jgi:cell wall-associated NlpC family hydrolase
MGQRVDNFVLIALSQKGDPYVLGAEASKANPNPRAFDCSELVEWAAGRAGLFMPDGTWAQYQHCKRNRKIITVEQAIRTRGALLFIAKGAGAGGGRGNHIAISLGDGRTIEARGRAYGTNVFNARGRRWTHGGLIPGGDYSHGVAAPVINASGNISVGKGFTQVLKVGSTGPNVKALQAKLGIKADGSFGPKTKAAVVAWQKRNRLTADGVVGPITRKRLFGF